ncbi:diguanylate cyclase domain-containing protein [Paraglaciecola sp. L3A3]|uniref:diguanylate cyclase domain-containing protein n=1 Tax=Paraglaciecola sp. L3A3 TaxID=2686358 RepID=UPI00131C5076|nr:diguanylate cyclase [Paraglaciecola sp. L3A3]
MNKNGLILRLTLAVVISAFVIGLIISQFYSHFTYINEKENGQIEVEQLFKTVSSTASVATYLLDKELATEVISGLMSNDIVKGVSITAKEFLVDSAGYRKTEDSRTFPLYSPFEKDRKVGNLVITPNIKHIEKRASEISSDNQISITIQAAIIVLIIVFVAYFIVTRPIIFIATRLHELSIGTNERIQLPNFHDNSEIGILVKDINLLLGKTENQITEERKLRQQVEKLSRHFKLLFENSNSPIVLAEPNGDIVLHNQAFDKLLQKLKVPFKTNFGPYLRDLFENPIELDHQVTSAFNHNEIASGEFKLNYNVEDNSIWVQTIVTATLTDDFGEYYQITLHDISAGRLKIEQLDLKARTDQLTNLLNRRGAKQTLTQLIESNVAFALILLDLNKFKPINDIYGHDAGDEILIHVAQQLTQALRRRDILSRWGGDEFVIILPGLTVEEVHNVCDKIISNIENPYLLTQVNETVSVSASVGVTFYQQDQVCDIDTLIKQADTTMYKVKENRDKQHKVMFFNDNV